MVNYPVPESDQEIIQKILAGNGRDFGRLVSRYQGRAMTLALRMIRDRREAEELVQDAFLRAYRSLGQFRGDAAFHTWLYRIVYNLSLSRLKRRGADPGTARLPDIEEGGCDIADVGAPGADELVEAMERTAVIAEEIGKLPQNFRIAVTLFYLQEMSYEEIAGIMEIPMGTVKTYLYRGRSLLSQRMLARGREGAHII